MALLGSSDQAVPIESPPWLSAARLSEPFCYALSSQYPRQKKPLHVCKHDFLSLYNLPTSMPKPVDNQRLAGDPQGCWLFSASSSEWRSRSASASPVLGLRLFLAGVTGCYHKRQLGVQVREQLFLVFSE